VLVVASFPDLKGSALARSSTKIADFCGRTQATPLLELVILLLLILLNGFFALSEIAFVGSQRRLLEKWADDGNLRAREVLLLLDDPQYFLSSVQAGITLIAIITGAYGGLAMVDDFAMWITQAGIAELTARKLAFFFTIGGITYFSVVLGELVPKSFALQHAEKIAVNTVPIVKRFALLLYPFVKLLTVSTKGLSRLLGLRESASPALSEDELQYMLKTAGKLGILELEESKVFQNLFSFTDQVAKSLMTPRQKMRWIDSTWSEEEMLAFIRRNSGTKFPVCKGGIDQIEGILYAKDFLEQYIDGEVRLDELLHPPVFLAPNMPSFPILTKFRENKEYIGIVLDEYGAVKGMVTLRDLIEAIIGDLPEAFDHPEADVFVREDGSWLINAHISVNELNQHFGREVVREAPLHYSTLAGYILFTLQRLPHTGEVIKAGEMRLEVVDMDGKRIDKILMSAEV
jgi:putative hemolysin